MQNTNLANQVLIKASLVMTNQMKIPGLDSFSGDDVYRLNNNISRGTPSGVSTQHNIVVVLADKVLPEPEDEVVVRYLNLS